MKLVCNNHQEYRKISYFKTVNYFDFFRYFFSTVIESLLFSINL